MKNRIRIGSGFDVHEFATNRKLILGGVEIPFYKGLLGHSDADALLHALCDAMLGSLALGDIGFHFPNTDVRFKDIDSKVLLEHTYSLIKENGYFVGNADIMILLQEPKIASYVQEMREVIASILETDIQDISIKATTTETLGFIGREEGIAVMASVLLFPIEQ